jgi:hypothetical protein
LNYASSVEVIAKFAEHIAALGIDCVRIGLPARHFQFFGSPHTKELIEANRLLPVVGDGHPIRWCLTVESTLSGAPSLIWINAK